MTKDYYKILDLKSDATDEEIRARWVELVKNYHVDFEMGEFDEKVKDINDAYHVLKNPATRLEYDLERTFEGKTKKSPLKKWVLRVGFGVILIVLGVVYFENPEISYHLLKKSQAVSVLPKHEQRLPISESRKPAATQVAGEEATTSARVLPPLQSPEGAGVDKREERTNPGDHNRDPLPDPGKPAEAGPGDQAKSREPEGSPPVEKVKPRKAVHPASGTQPARQPGDGPKAGQTTRVQKTTALDPPSSKAAGIAPVEMVMKVAQANASSPDTKKPTPANPHAPSALLAREDEVKEFFQNYAKAYARADVNAFLDLFSPKAVQNRNEGFEDLKGTYRRFFNQSRELRYQLQDLKFEIYKNVVEATARYVLDQVLKRNGGKRTWRGTARWVLAREDGTLKIISLDYQHQESL